MALQYFSTTQGESFSKKLCSLLIITFFWTSMAAAANAPDPVQQFKDFLNNTVESVISAEHASDKRLILNQTLDLFIQATAKALEDPSRSEEAIASIEQVKTHFEEKKAELNGENGFTAVPEHQLNDFARYLQQDTEQAWFVNSEENPFLFLLIIALTVVIILNLDL